jgi:MraZ protein
MDAKGRLTIPSAWRLQAEGETFLALPNPAGYVTVYPPEMIARLKERVSGISMGDVEGQAALTALMSMAHSFTSDKQGRINLNERLIRHAGIRKEAVLLGKVSTFSIYSAEAYEAVKPGDSQGMMAALARFGL